MDLAERINFSIDSLRYPEEKVFDFDKEVELLFELKKVLNEHLNNQNVITNYNKQVEVLNKTTSFLKDQREELEKKYNETISELNKFCELMQDEISGKMRLLGYPEKEIERVSRMNSFSEIFDLREKVFREFDVKFEVKYAVKDTPKKGILNYSIFKI